MFPRDEIWIRKVYEPEVSSKELTRIFKAGDRIYPNPKYFIVGEEIKIKIVEIPGNDITQCMPVVSDKYQRSRIKNITVKNINELVDEDFKGASKDIKDTVSLRYHLGILNDRTPESFETVSIIDIEYL